MRMSMVKVRQEYMNQILNSVGIYGYILVALIS